MSLANGRSISRCNGFLPTTVPASTKASGAQCILSQRQGQRQGQRQRLILRPVTSVTAIVTTRLVTVTQPTKTPLYKSLSSCQPLHILSAQRNCSSLTARNSVYSSQRAQLTQRIQRINQAGCTGLFTFTSSQVTHHPYWTSTSLSHAPRRAFSISNPTMAATKIDGTAIAKRIRERLAAEIVEKQKLNPKYEPCLKIIQGLYSPTMPRSRSYIILTSLISSW